MRAVRSKDTSPEIIVRQWLYANGYRYRLHRKDLPGKPDIIFSGRKKIIFVHGCFWHGHDCPRGDRIPQTNTLYWKSKIGKNVARDNANIQALNNQGWRTLIIWECETRVSQRDKLANKILAFLDNNDALAAFAKK